MKFAEHLSEIAAPYRGFIIDLWGVMHDGTHLYPGALDALEALKRDGKHVVFLSNAPRRTAKVLDVLDKLGVPRALYDGALASGEAGYLAIREGAVNFGKRYFYIGPDKDADVLRGLDHVAVSKIEEADYLLNVGFGSEAEDMSNWDGVLQAGAKRKLPMLCLNPDFEVVKITGERFPCAGVLARAYERFGGEVTYFGKPYPEVYSLAFSLLGDLPKSEVMAIGDSLHTDIAGARNAGIASVLVTGGIMKQVLGDVGVENVRAHLAGEDVQPDFVLPLFQW